MGIINNVYALMNELFHDTSFKLANRLTDRNS